MSRWLVLLPVLLLACASGAEHETEAAQAALASHRATMAALGALPQPGRAGAPSSAALAEPRATPGRIAAPMPGQQAPLTPPRAASSLLGASPEAVRAALGEPVLQRSEGPAQVWLYAGAGCQLDIVLYDSEAGPRVAHVQARAGGLAQRTEASCLRDLAGGAVPGGGAGAAPGAPPGGRPMGGGSQARGRPSSSAIGTAASSEIDV